jgi:type VI secretion system protein ImpJ
VTRVNEIPDAIQWHEGMLLAPQHFQQLALRTEAMLQYQMLIAAPFHWGVRRFRVDPVLLPQGTFRILELEAVMPDGLSVLYHDGTATDLTVSLVGRPVERSGYITVYLVVPAARGASVSSTGEFARYASYDGAPVVDLNTGDGELPIPRLRPRIALMAGDAPPDKFVSMPLARVAYRDESFALTEFIPPLLHVSMHSELGGMCARTLKRIREKAVFLADRARAASATAKRPLVFETQLMAQTLASGLPPVEAILRTGVTHPYPLFLSMCGLVGQIAGVGSALVPPALEAYDHNNLHATFDQIVTYINGILDGVQEDFRPVPFQAVEGGFELAIDPAWIADGSLMVGAVGAASVSESDLALWLDNALIASRSRMTSLRERRVRGPGRMRLAAPDTVGIAPRRGEVIASITADPQYIEPGEVLQLLNPGDAGRGRPEEVVLYVATRV